MEQIVEGTILNKYIFIKVFRIYGTIQKSRYERALMTAHQVGAIVAIFIVIFMFFIILNDIMYRHMNK